MILATFDIFDTALIRKCGRPDTIFNLLARKLYPENAAAREDFLHWRRFQTKGDTLAEKYAGVKEDFSEYTVEQLMEAEMLVESENLTVNPAVKQIIEQKRKEGFTIKFLSDMYLPSDFLAEILKREGCLEDDEEVIVSCEHNARKDTGTLYNAVRKKYNPTEWGHYGDNKRSDIHIAKKKGIKAIWIDTQYTKIEQRLLQKAERLFNGHQLQLLAGASRTARIKAGNTPEAILAADHVIPTYLPYIIFTLEEARNRGIDKLYFLSRDGYILYEIAKALQPNDIELHYFFVSRKSLQTEDRLIKEYIHQEKLDEGKNGIVDVGWHGTTRKAINEKLEEMGASPVTTFYLGVRRDVLSRRYGEFISYYRLGNNSTSANTPIIESYLSASPWPSTIDYKSQDGKIVPVFADNQTFQMTTVVKAHVEVMQSIIKNIADIQHFKAEVLRLWSDESISSLASITFPTDLSPMVSMNGIEGKTLVKRIGLFSLLNLLFLGAYVTDFDRGSLEYTLGHSIAKSLWPIHTFTFNIRRRLYHKFLKR